MGGGACGGGQGRRLNSKLYKSLSRTFDVHGETFRRFLSLYQFLLSGMWQIIEKTK